MPLSPEDRIAAVRDANRLLASGVPRAEVEAAIQQRYLPEGVGLPDSAEMQASRANHYRRVGKFGFDPFEASLDPQTRESLPGFVVEILDETVSPVSLLALAAGGPLSRGLVGGASRLGRALLSGRAGGAVVNAIVNNPLSHALIRSAGFSLPFAAGEAAERIEQDEPFFAESAKLMLFAGAIDGAFGLIGLPGGIRERAKRIAGEIAQETFLANLARPVRAITPEAEAAAKAGIVRGLSAATGEAASQTFAKAVDEARLLSNLERLGVSEGRIREALLSVQEGAPPEQFILQAGENLSAGLGRLRDRLRRSGLATPERVTGFDPSALDARALASIHAEGIVAGAEKAATEAGLTLNQQRDLMTNATSELMRVAGAQDFAELKSRFPIPARSIENYTYRLDLAEQAAGAGYGTGGLTNARFAIQSLVRNSDEFLPAGKLSVGDVVLAPTSDVPLTVRAIHAASRLAESYDPAGNRLMLHSDQIVRRLQAVEQRGLLPTFIARETAATADDVAELVRQRGPGPVARAAAAPRPSPLVQPPPDTIVTRRVAGGAAARTEFQRLPEQSAIGNAPLRTRDPISPTAGVLTPAQRSAQRILERPEREAVKRERDQLYQQARRAAEVENRLDHSRRDALRVLEVASVKPGKQAKQQITEFRAELERLQQITADRGPNGIADGMGAVEYKTPRVPDTLPVPPEQRELMLLHNRVREMGGEGIEKALNTPGVLTSVRAGPESARRLRTGAGDYIYSAVMPDTVLRANSLPSLKAAIDQYRPVAPKSAGQRLRQTLDAISGKIPGCPASPRAGPKPGRQG